MEEAANHIKFGVSMREEVEAVIHSLDGEGEVHGRQQSAGLRQS